MKSRLKVAEDAENACKALKAKIKNIKGVMITPLKMELKQKIEEIENAKQVEIALLKIQLKQHIKEIENTTRNQIERLKTKVENYTEKVEKSQIIPLQNELKRQEEICGQRWYEAYHPYIQNLDRYLNCLDIIKICLSYLSEEYCVNCETFFPKRFECISCDNFYNIDDDDIKELKYSPYGLFSVMRISEGYYRPSEKIIVEFYDENDISFLSYLIENENDKVKIVRSPYEGNRFIIDSIGRRNNQFVINRVDNRIILNQDQSPVFLSPIQLGDNAKNNVNSIKNYHGQNYIFYFMLEYNSKFGELDCTIKLSLK